MSSGNHVHVGVEYCGACNYRGKFEELMKTVKNSVPQAEISGEIGRTGSFEVKVNGTLIHSKLATLAFPDFNDVALIAESANNGEDIRPSKPSPITDCSLS